MVALKVVSSNQTDGVKKTVPIRFVEVWKWKEQNKKKKVPLDRVVKRKVLDEAGNKKEAEGIWERTGPSGIHEFERYEDQSTNTNSVLDNGECIVAEGQSERMHELSAKQLNISKVLTLEDICAIDDQSEDDGGADAKSDKPTDSDDSESEFSDEDVPIFNNGVASGVVKKKAA